MFTVPNISARTLNYEIRRHVETERANDPVLRKTVPEVTLLRASIASCVIRGRRVFRFRRFRVRTIWPVIVSCPMEFYSFREYNERFVKPYDAPAIYCPNVSTGRCTHAARMYDGC